MRRDLGIYLGDADDTKRGFPILNPSTRAVQVRLDCVKLELTDQMLHSYYDSRLSLSDVNKCTFLQRRKCTASFHVCPRSSYE